MLHLSTRRTCIECTSNTVRITHMCSATMLHDMLTLSMILRQVSFLACKPSLQDSGFQCLAASYCDHTSAVPVFVAAAICRNDHYRQVRHYSAEQLFWQLLGPSSPEPRLWPQEWGPHHPISACTILHFILHMAWHGELANMRPQAESELQLFASYDSSLQ